MEHALETAKNHDHAAAARRDHGLAPAAAPLPPAVEWQQAAGNQAMQELLRSGYLHTKLAISNPDDPEEREADDVANRIMRKAAGAPAASHCSCSEGEEQCDECKLNPSGPSIQRRATSPAAAPRVPRIVGEVLRSPGHPLDASTRAFFEPRFGRDFSDVRVHTDPLASSSAEAIKALAYAHGNHMVFRSGQYNAGSSLGKQLLAHELTHVVQQSNAKDREPLHRVDSLGSDNQRLGIDESGESNAKEASRNVLAGNQAGPILTQPNLAIQCQFEFFEVPEAPIEFPEFEMPEIPESPEFEVPEEGIETPESEGELPDGEGEAPESDTGSPESDSPGSEGQTEEGTGTQPETHPIPEPFPPVGPVPHPDEPDEDRDKKCGDPDLPLTNVTFAPGPLGQGKNVKAMPLTRCPGNTRGSPPDRRIFEEQFKCIAKAGQTGYWLRAHLLHGKTRRHPLLNLHGPGNDMRNLIITDQSLNQKMNAGAEDPAIDLVHRNKQVLWYESSVDSYLPGLDYFAKSVTVNYGFYNPITKVPSPRSGGGTFSLSSDSKPPNCPASPQVASTVPAVPAPPSNQGQGGTSAQGGTPAPSPGTTDKSVEFESTLQICRHVLDSRTFHVSNGGLQLRIASQWFDEAHQKELTQDDCPIRSYSVTLLQKGWIWDSEIKTWEIPIGKAVKIPIKRLEPDDYYFKISTDNDNPNCCLTGELIVSTFDAPRRTHSSHRLDELA